MRDNGALAFAELAPENPYRIIACFIEGSAAAYLGDLERARDRLTEGIRLGADVLPAVHAQCLTKLSRVELVDDNPVGADRLIDEAMRVVADAEIGDRPVTCLCYSRAAVMHLRRGDNAAGDTARAHALDLVERAEDLSPYHILACRLDLAMAAVMARDLDAARPLLEEGERRLARLPETGTLDDYAAQIRSMLEVAASPEYHLIEPLTPAELRVLAYLPTHLSFGEIGEELFVSRNTVKSHAMAVYRKLAVTSRSAAVAEATRLGLLAA
jgi:LuxR family maltose regulon positive regulatory protein